MKLQTVAQSLTPALPLLRCPLCGEPLSLAQGQSLLCGNRHCYDLSAKGYVNLAPNRNQTLEKYDAALFESRRRVFAAGFYAPVAAALCQAIATQLDASTLQAGVVEPPVVLDAGCGEGYYARELANLPQSPVVVGVDLSRDALLAAARQPPLLPYLVADLTRLPLQDASVDALVDVLTPADYAEFARVLKPGGLLYKIVPAEDYLTEVRAAVTEHLRGEPFSNARVIEHLRDHADILSRTVVRQQFSVTPEQAQDFLRMTPMTFSLSDEQLAGVTFGTITVAMELLVCHMRR